MVRISNSIQRELLSDNGINSTKLQYANVMRCYFVHVFINMRDFSFFFLPQTTLIRFLVEMLSFLKGIVYMVLHDAVCL